MSDSQKPLLIFDLDETLIHASETELMSKAHLRFDRYHIYERPYLHEVLLSLTDYFKLAI